MALADHLRQTSAKIVIEYDSIEVDDVLPKLEQRLTQPDFFPRLERATSPQAGGGVALMSSSGASQVGVFGQKTQFSVQFYANYSLPGRATECIEYASRKMKPLLEVMVEATPIRFIAVVFDQRIAFAGMEKSEELLARAYGTLPALSAGLLPWGNAHEFTSRIAHVVDEKFFLNLYLEQYEDRQASVQTQRSGDFISISTPPQIRLHETSVSERGLAVRVDVNTKYLSYKELPALGLDDWDRCFYWLRQTQTEAIPKLLTHLGN